MIKNSFTFNGSVSVTLIPENGDDKRLLELVFNGREVKSIRPGPDESIVLEMGKSGPETIR